jgi:hypothetical protein
MIAASVKTFGEVPIAAALELLRGKNRNVYFGEMKSEAFGAYHGLKEAGRSWIKAWRTEEPTDMWSKAEIPFMRAIPSKDITISGKTFSVGGKQVRIPTRILLATDEFFKTEIYRASLSRQAYSIAHKEGLKADTAISRITELLESPTEEMTSKAHQEALYQTFNTWKTWIFCGSIHQNRYQSYKVCGRAHTLQFCKDSNRLFER